MKQHETVTAMIECPKGFKRIAGSDTETSR